MSPKGPFTGMSWLQVVAGALAAMTSAWVASYLGVAGTIIGAAVGSLVASIASALYVRGLDRGTTFITESGSVVYRPRPAGETPASDDVEILTTQADSSVVVEESDRAFSWKRVLLWAGAGLVTALLAIGAFELVTGDSFGNSNSPSIGRPWQDTGTKTDRPADPEPTETVEPTDDPTPVPTTEPTAPVRTTPPATPPAPVAPDPMEEQQPDPEPTAEVPPGQQE